MRIAIIEDEIIIAQFIEQQMQECFQADTRMALDPEEAPFVIEEFKPHLVLCDIELGGSIDGIDLMHQFKTPLEFELIFVTSYQSRRIINRAYGLSPANYIIKPLDENRLYASVLPAIKKITAIQRQEPGDFIRWLTGTLTEMEFTILQLIAGGHSSKEIAEALCLSPYTVKNHRNHICRKLNLDEGYNTLLRWALTHSALICSE